MKNEMIAEPVKGSDKYKQTEIGLIPEEWDLFYIGELFNFRNGLNKAKEFFGHGTPIVNYMDVFRRPYLLGNNLMGKVAVSNSEIKSFEILKGDVFFTRTSETVDEIGMSSVLIDDVPNGVFSGFLLRARPISNALNLEFKKYCFLSSIVRKQITSKSSYTTRALTNGRLLSMVKIPVPTKEEQTAIAEALSDADAMIASLEQLIEKKKKIKQGAMQELLSPTDANGKMKKGWVKKKLGEVCNRITTGKLDANAMNPDGDYRFYTCAKSFYHIDIFAFDDEALLVSGNGENVGYVHYFKGKFNAYQRTYVLTGFKENIQFIKKYLDKFLAARIESEMNAGNTPYIKMGTLSDMDIFLPNEIDEQNYIAEILENMNLEIELIEIKLDKAKKIKQGMMQNLLTGKIRLI